MKTLVKKSVSIMMVIGCLMGTAAFADTEGAGMQEVIEMEVCKAVDVLGGIPEYIQGPDREDLEVMLSNIDEYNAAGLYDQANALWESVYQLIAPYQEQFGGNTENNNETKTDEELIQEKIQQLEERIMRYEGIGDYTSADELRETLERLLTEVYGVEDPDVNNDPDDQHGDFEGELSPEDIDRMIEEVEAEIARLEQTGDFEAANALRNELEGFLNEHGGQEGHDGFDGALSPDDVKMMIEETEAEIENLERNGDFEAANALRNELEGFLNEQGGHEGHDEFHEEPEENHHLGQELLSLEEIMSRAGHDLSPEELAILTYLVNEINDIASE